MNVARLRNIKGTPEHAHRIAKIKEWGGRNPDRLRIYQARYKEKYRLRKLVWAAMQRCHKSGMPYDKEFLIELIQIKPSTCQCCASRIDYSVDAIVRYVPKLRSPSLDRIDTQKGYVRGNVAIICWRCNALKRDGTVKEIEAIAAYMRKHHDGK